MTETPAVPSWYPAWSKRLAELYYSGTARMFLLHGNVGDYVRAEAAGKPAYLTLADFLATQVFGTFTVVLHYDVGKGLRCLAGADALRLSRMNQDLAAEFGDVQNLPREPERILPLLDRYLERKLLVQNGERGPVSVAVIFDYAQFVVPASDIGALSRGSASTLATFLNWASSPYMKRVGMAFVLVSNRLSELSPELVRCAHTAEIEIGYPDEAERRDFANWSAGDSTALASSMPAEALARLTAGMTCLGLDLMIRDAVENRRPVDVETLKRVKKEMIESQCQGLLEFISPRFSLDTVIGCEAAKTRLRGDAELVKKGMLQWVPMGYLICGAVGTGKSFLAECHAGTIGIPCVKLKNFRSKYVGETEGNLEMILGVLRALGPVAVIVDEADAQLGTRESEGDSGTSSRVFGQIAQQMGDTRYRGQIIWFLLTCRPDLLPVDLKRQGRAEVHIPLFPPETPEETRQMFLSMAKKNGYPLSPEDVPDVSPDRRLSGADIESIALQARRLALLESKDHVERAHIERAINDFVATGDDTEKEMQELAAVLECTETQFLPKRYSEILKTPDGRSRLRARYQQLRAMYA